MASTFLSIILTSVIAIAGLISAGILSPTGIDIPEEFSDYQISLFFVDSLTIPGEEISKIVSTMTISSAFYLFSASMLFIFGIIYFALCLNVEPMEPEEHVRNVAGAISFTDTEETSNTVQREWIETNARNIEALELRFDSAKYHLGIASSLFGYSIALIVYMVQPSITPFLFVVILLPVFMLVLIISLGRQIVTTFRSYHGTYIVPESPVIYPESVRCLDPLIAGLIANYRNSTMRNYILGPLPLLIFYPVSVFFAVAGLIIQSAAMISLIY
jgi:hypothetical protein